MFELSRSNCEALLNQEIYKLSQAVRVDFTSLKYGHHGGAKFCRAIRFGEPESRL